MDKELLYNFFKGNVSIEEGLKVKAWVEASKENEKTFYGERKIFDALQLNTPLLETKSPIPHSRKSGTQWLKIAALIILTLVVSYIYREFTTRQETEAMNIVSVPAGQRTNITLPDGTNVWLNTRTTLKYSTAFNKRERIVLLEGEAFFDVKKNKDKPFIVKTKAYNVEALGTEFNVDAYPETTNFEAVLMNGSIKVSSQVHPSQNVILKPEQKISLENGQLKVTQIDDYNPYRWKEGLICFRNTGFSDIIKTFEKCYGIKIVIENKNTLKYRFTGKFRQADGIDYILQVIQQSINFKFEKDNEEQIIYIK